MANANQRHAQRRPKSDRPFTRAEILESLIYELKPFALALFGALLIRHFSHPGEGVPRTLSLVLVLCGLFIGHRRAKARGLLY